MTRRCNAAVVCENPAGHNGQHIGHTPSDTEFRWVNDTDLCPATAPGGMHCDQTLTQHRYSTDGELIHSGWTTDHGAYLSWWNSTPTGQPRQP